ncbi:MAG: electron transport complex subunit RsxC, partial [Gammaproteobacteria bacterium]|nr:electron transport complex subunit RsxC [Gammaproteobacteria bacterium]
MTYPMKAGLPLVGYRAISTQLPVERAPIPDELILPLTQHIGAPSRPVVEIGDHVEKGQLIARAQGFVSANLHAPINATVKAIELRPVPHPSGLDGECIILKPDEGASWSSPVSKSISQADIKKCEPQDIRQKIRNAGIVGMGGATFPTSVKIKT